MLTVLGLPQFTTWLACAPWPWPWPLKSMLSAVRRWLMLGNLQSDSLLASLALSRRELMAVAEWLVHAQEDDPLLILKWDAAQEAAVTTGGPLLFYPNNSRAVCSCHNAACPEL